MASKKAVIPEDEKTDTAPAEKPLRSVILGPCDMLYRLSEKIKLRKHLTDAF